MLIGGLGARDCDIRECYDIFDEKLGSGGFGQVRSCVDVKTGDTLAVKLFDRKTSLLARLDASRLVKNEIDLLETVHHPNIVCYYEFFVDDRFYYAVGGGVLCVGSVWGRGRSLFLCLVWGRSLRSFAGWC